LTRDPHWPTLPNRAIRAEGAPHRLSGSGPVGATAGSWVGLFESNETVILQLRNPPPARVLLGSRSRATFVIVNDDQRVRFATTVFSVAEGSVGQMVVVREGRPNDTTTVRYAVIGGTASQGPDYKLPDGT
jgi:hypothetical protein